MAEILHVTTVRSLSCNRRGGIGKARRFPSSDIVRIRSVLRTRSNDVSSVSFVEDRVKENESVVAFDGSSFWKVLC